MNRALIVKSFYEELEIIGSSQCDDVVKMEESLFHFKQSETMNCGAAGTTLRFLMARTSREEGEFHLTGDHRLFERPHRGLIDILKQLSVTVDYPEKNYMRIVSKGWNYSQAIQVDMEQSSQFASALLLSAWELPKKLELHLSENKNSMSYLQMTIDFLRQLGMEIDQKENKITVEAGQILKATSISIEPDMSSCFAIAAIAATSGEAVLENFPAESLQPDYRFIDILKKLNVPIDYNLASKSLTVRKAEQIPAIELNLKDNSDLFPVLSAFLINSQGISEISGIDHLVHKESDRLQNTIDLINSVGGSCRVEHQRFYLQGKPHISFRTLEFDPDKDHRMAMAAALLNYKGANIEILNKEVVNKSFPEFWQILGET